MPRCAFGHAQMGIGHAKMAKMGIGHAQMGIGRAKIVIGHAKIAVKGSRRRLIMIQEDTNYVFLMSKWLQKRFTSFLNQKRAKP